MLPHERKYRKKTDSKLKQTQTNKRTSTLLFQVKYWMNIRALFSLRNVYYKLECKQHKIVHANIRKIKMSNVTTTTTTTTEMSMMKFRNLVLCNHQSHTNATLIVIIINTLIRSFDKRKLSLCLRQSHGIRRQSKAKQQ